MPTRLRHTAEDKDVKSTKFLLQASCNMWAHLHQVTRWVRNGSRQLCCTRKAASQRLCRDSSSNSGRSRSLRILVGNAVRQRWSKCLPLVTAQLVHSQGASKGSTTSVSKDFLGFVIIKSVMFLSADAGITQADVQSVRQIRAKGSF